MRNKKYTDVKNAAFSSLFVTTITQPLQVIRTSMLVLYKDGKIVGMIDMFKKVSHEEGIKGFYRGFIASTVKTVLGSVVYFSTLEEIKYILKKNHLHESLDRDKHTYKHNLINFLSGGIARTLQSTMTNPILIVKTRFEVVGCNKYKSLLGALNTIKKEEGISGYFKGLKQTLIKDVPHSALFFSMYEFFKYVYSNYFQINNLQIQVTLATLSSNIILTLLTNPIDVLRTRVQYFHISKNSQHDYKGVLSGLTKIAKEEGIRGLCAGILPRFLKKAIGSALIWTSYETLKNRSELNAKI